MTNAANKKKKVKKENVHAGHRKRMREKCIENGVGILQDHEIIEMLLYYCIPMKDTNVMAHRIMNEFGSFGDLLSSDFLEIKNRSGLRDNSALLFPLINELYKRKLMEQFEEKSNLNNLAVVGDFLVSLLSNEKVEKFYMLCLDPKCRLISNVLLCTGGPSDATVSIRSIVNYAIQYKASKVIFAHNHPGGSVKPSREDHIVTAQVIELLKRINIEVVDHIIVAQKKYYSILDSVKEK